MLYTRATRLLQELQVSHGDGSFSRRLSTLARLDVLVLDDLAIAPSAAQERQDLLELQDDRVGSRSTLITSQLPNSAWHQWLNEPTIADAIMDRLLHGSHTLALKGESLRRAKTQAWRHPRQATGAPFRPRLAHRGGVASPSAAATVDKAAATPNNDIQYAFGTGLSTRRQGAAWTTRQALFQALGRTAF